RPFDLSSGSITYAIPNEAGEHEIRETETIIDIDTVNYHPTAAFYSGDSRHEALISLNAILGTCYPGISVLIIVKAFDKEFNLLNKSLPLISNYEDVTVVRVENRELTAGERLILNIEYEEAIEYYEALLEDDSTNIEALTYLSRIYAHGWML